MPFTIRPYRRFSLCCPVTYHAGLSEGSGTMWNLSVNSLRFSGDLPLRVGQSFPLSVTLSDKQSIFLVAGIVRWKRGEEYGVKSLVLNDSALCHVKHYIMPQAGEGMTP